MSQSRFAALLAVSGLLAAVFASGCSAPKSSEKARFGTVIGTVVDINGNPVPGALVTVVPRASSGAIGTTNYFGDTGPFVTDARGRFFIQGVTLQPTDTAVLNLRVTREGFTPGFASVTTTSAVTVGGRTIPAGTQTADIVVSGEVVPNVVATLQGVGQVTEVGSAGATITVGVPSTGGVALGNATVTIPAGAVAQPTVISVTPLTGSALPGGAQILAGSPSQQLGPGQTVNALIPLAAVDLEPTGLTFPAGLEPTIVLPLPVSFPAGTVIPIYVFDEATANWVFETNGTVTAAGNAVTFKVTHFSTRMAALVSTWSEGALSATLETEVFPPIATLPNGYVVTDFLQQSLVFTGATAAQNAALGNAYGALTGQEANGPFPIAVPAGTTLGVRAERHTIPVTVTIFFPNGTSQTFTGVRTLWQAFIVPVAGVPNPNQQHFQGHIQGAAVGS